MLECFGVNSLGWSNLVFLDKDKGLATRVRVLF